MKKARYNIFEKSHKGLYRLTFEAGSKIQHANFNCINEINKSITILLQAIQYYKYHIAKEDFVIYNAIVPVAPYIITLMENANQIGNELVSEIEEKIQEFQIDLSHHNLIEFGIELQSSVFSFTSVVLQHIQKENSVINDLLWACFTDEDLAAMELKIASQFLPEENEWYTGQVIKWLNDQEIVDCINDYFEFGSKSNANSMLTAAEKNLPTDRWTKVHSGISMQRA